MQEEEVDADRRGILISYRTSYDYPVSSEVQHCAASWLMSHQ